MTMKMFDKKDCEYKGGYIVCDGKVVNIDNEVVDLLNKLEEDVQRKQFEDTHCAAAPCYQEPGEFMRTTEHGEIFPVIRADTPELDKMTEHAMKIMDEVDAMADAEKANEYFAGIKPLIMFVNDEFIVSCEQATQHRFDLPTIGNPLELTKDDVADWVLGLFD